MEFIHNYEEDEQIREDARNSKHLTNAAMCPICNRKPEVYMQPVANYFTDKTFIIARFHMACLQCQIHGLQKYTVYHAVKAWNTMVQKVTAKIEMEG